ncbi:MAG: hypothetical protein M3024_10960, partial [Candidatus Dormibacteraeota bacterium]|nr:hypothetical protein [Candidatus Dormibacteraeota bacterium]
MPFRFTKGQEEAGIKAFGEIVIPAARQRQGYAGIFLLLDRELGRGASVAYYGDKASMDAAAAEGTRMRDEIAARMDLTVTRVIEGEMAVVERTAPPAPGTWVRMNLLQGDPQKADEGIAFVREKVVPSLRRQNGFRALLQSVNRETGETAVGSVWATRADLDAS